MGLPHKKFAQLQYLEGRVEGWSENQATLQLGLQQAGAAVASTDAARAAYDAYQQSVRDARDARVTWLSAIATAARDGRSCLRTINTTAKNSTNPEAIYALASVTPPKRPEPLGAPQTPTKLTIRLDTEGRANLTWGGSRVGGTVFTLQRRTTGIAGQLGPWTTIATVPERTFVDTATPSGVLNISYRVRGERVGGVSSFSLPVTLPLGAAGNQPSVAGAIAPVEASGKQAG